MPDNDHPTAKSKTQAIPVETELFAPAEITPRVKKRSLKPKPSPRDLEREAPPLSAQAARPEYQAPESEDEPDFNPGGAVPSPSRPQADASTTKPGQPQFASTARPSALKQASAKTTSPHGTRPATLYYSSAKPKDSNGKSKDTAAPAKEKEPASPAPTPTPMKTTTASTASSATPVAATRPATVVDYRTNIDRQAREQKSVGGVLSILVYTLIGFVVVGAILAGYGAYVVHQALHDQSVTVTQLDDRYSAANKDLNARLATTLDTLTQAQAQIGRQQQLILQQEETINKLLTTSDKLVNAVDANAAALRQERSIRADETSSLRARLRDLEYKGPTTRSY